MVRRSEIEELISRLPGVLAVRLSVNDWGAIDAVHVLATVERAAKQIVRDIESALQARFGLRLNHRKVSIAQVRGLGPLRDPVRPQLAGYVTQTETSLGRTRIEVTFRDPRDETTRWEGAAEGGSRRHQQARTALLATLEALRPLLVQERDLELVDCELVTVSAHELLVGVFALPSERAAEPQIFAGAAPVGSTLVEAAAQVFRAVYEQLLEQRERRIRQSAVVRLLEMGRPGQGPEAAAPAGASRETEPAGLGTGETVAPDHDTDPDAFQLGASDEVAVSAPDDDDRPVTITEDSSGS